MSHLVKMTATRYEALNAADPAKLTTDEIAAGWHWCYDWDYLLTCSEEANACGYTVCGCAPTSESKEPR